MNDHTRGLAQEMAASMYAALEAGMGCSVAEHAASLAAAAAGDHRPFMQTVPPLPYSGPRTDRLIWMELVDPDEEG